MDKLNAFITVCNEKGVAIKDNFCTKGIRTTAASKILDNFIPEYNATVVEKILASGTKIRGKTNMDSFAHGSSTETSDYGVVKNPHDLSCVAGGSSGGSAAAVAADMCDWAMGSETAGSIRGPAAWCGVVGLKPSYGRVSRYGLIAMASSTDCPGPIAKSVPLVKKAYEIIKGVDPMDATTHEFKSLKVKSVKGLKIGLPTEYFRDEGQKEVNQSVLEAAKRLEKLGAKLIDVSSFDPQYSIAVYTIIMRSEVSSNLARFDGIRYGNDRSNFNDENVRRIILGTYTLQSGYYDQYYQKAQKIRTIIIDDFKKIFKDVDLLLAPTMPTVAPKIGVTDNQAMFGELTDILNEPSAVAGLPAISVPCGFVGKLPIGMQLIGPMGSEEQLLETAGEFERI